MVDVIDVQGRILTTPSATTGGASTCVGFGPDACVVVARWGSTCFRQVFVKR